MAMMQLEPCGAFQFLPASQVWSWSPEACAIYGVPPGEALLGTELLLERQHPEDRATVAAFLDDVLSAGLSGSLWHRILVAGGAVRRLLTTATAQPAGTDRPMAVRGHVVDVTEAMRLTTAQDVDRALELLQQSRPAIEQAKGALMAAYGIDADEAFTLLRRYSQACNVKVRDVAREIVASMVSQRGMDPAIRGRLDRMAAQGPRPFLERLSGS
jgi:hypothetical protein